MFRRALLDDFFKPDERASQNEKDVRRVDVDEFLIRVLSSALRRNGSLRALDDFQKSLLHAFARNVAGNRSVFALSRNLVYFVDEDDSALGLRYVSVRSVDELEKHVLNVLADIARLGECGRVRNRKRHFELLRESSRQKRLSASSRPDEENVRFFYLDFIVRLFRLAQNRKPLVMVVDRDAESLFRIVLAHDILVEIGLEFLGTRHLAQFKLLDSGFQILERPLRQKSAVLADENIVDFRHHELSLFVARLSAKRAEIGVYVLEQTHDSLSSIHQ